MSEKQQLIKAIVHYLEKFDVEKLKRICRDIKLLFPI